MGGRPRRAATATGAAAVAVALVLGACTPPPPPPTPPGQSATGFGSTEAYVSSGATRYETGSGAQGTRVWWFEPHTLRDGDTAPVVVFLHGFALLAPDIYGGHIDHLTRQGYLVVFPQFQKGGLGLLGDTDQNDFLARAIDAVDVALDEIGSAADLGDVVVYGHSLGALLATVWNPAGGVRARAVVAANPSIGAGAVPAFVDVTAIDVPPLAAQVDVPVVVLTGEDDTIAPPGEAVALHGLLTGAPSRVVYQARTDRHGAPELVADHNVAMQDSGWIPDWMMSFLGGAVSEDAYDFRIHYAALDAALAGQSTVAFAMGSWSDGTPVRAPLTLAT